MTVDGAFRVRVEPVEALGKMALPPAHFDPDLLRSFVLLLGSPDAEAPDLDVRAA